MIDFSFGGNNFCGKTKRTQSGGESRGDCVVTCEEQKSVGREVFIYESQKGV